MSADNSTVDFTPGVVELRQYGLRPGHLDTVVDIFESHLVDAQRAVGVAVPGLFRDRDRPDWFVWLRGFADMASRPAGLEAFYTSPVWVQHRKPVLSAITEFDVRLLRPVGGGLPTAPAADPTGNGDGDSTVLVLLWPVATDDAGAFAAQVAELVHPDLARAGWRPLATYATETATNNYPALPIREDEHLVVTVARTDTAAPAPALPGDLPTSGPVRVLRLAPTARSAVR